MDDAFGPGALRLRRAFQEQHDSGYNSTFEAVLTYRARKARRRLRAPGPKASSKQSLVYGLINIVLIYVGDDLRISPVINYSVSLNYKTFIPTQSIGILFIMQIKHLNKNVELKLIW